MRITRLPVLTLATVACTVLCGSPSAAQGMPSDGAAHAKVRFAPPVRIRAGDAFLGAGRLYPSPVLHDVDGDERLDIVIGDLMGRVTVARRADDKAVSFASEMPFEGRDGKQLEFHNW